MKPTTCDHTRADWLEDLPADSPARTRTGWSTRLNDRQREALWLNLVEPCPACRRETLERIASEAPPPPPPRIPATGRIESDQWLQSLVAFGLGALVGVLILVAFWLGGAA